MKKIWDSQNNQPLYAINEAALFRRIQAKGRRAKRLSNINDVGLIIIMGSVAIALFFMNKGTFYGYLSSSLMLGIAVYTFFKSMQKQKNMSQYDRSMLGELDAAIAHINFEITRARTFVWWMLIPAVLPIAIRWLTEGLTTWTTWKWMVVFSAFPLAYVLVQWELKRCHIPKKLELEALRQTLTDE